MRVLKSLTPSPAMVIACFALLLVLGGTGIRGQPGTSA